jgi:hypothetical protein
MRGCLHGRHKYGSACQEREGLSQTEFACHSRMNHIKIWKAKLDYLVVRQTHEQKSGSGCRQQEGAAQIQVFMLRWDESD